MYARWLRFFYSPQKETGVRGKKGEQVITREYLPDGNMRISGKQPSAWSITLQPAPSMNLYQYLYKAKNEKRKALEDMNLSIDKRDKAGFSRAEKAFSEGTANEKRGLEIVERDHKRLDTNLERIFQAKRNLYLYSLKPKKEKSIKAQRRLEKELSTLADEQRENERAALIRVQEFSPGSSSLRQQGPVPEPPVIQTRSSRKRVAKKVEEETESESESDGEETETESESESNNEKEIHIDVEDVEAESDSEQTGGIGVDIKVIKLDE